MKSSNLISRAVLSCVLIFASPACRPDDNASWYDILENEAKAEALEVTLEAVPEGVEIAIRDRSLRISKVYSEGAADFMSIFGRANSLGKNSQWRQTIQSWASKRSIYYATKAATVKIAGKKIAATSRYALRYGAIPLIEQSYIAFELSRDIELLQASNKELNLSQQDLAEFFTATALKTIQAGLEDTVRYAAIKMLGKAISTTAAKGAVIPLGVAWEFFGEPDIAGSASESMMPNPSNQEEFVRWAKDVTSEIAYHESRCITEVGCLERTTMRLTGYIALFKLKYDYLSSIDSPLASHYAWVRKYKVCPPREYGYCKIDIKFFQFAAANEPVYRDVGTGHWASCYVRKLWGAGILGGHGGDFRPASSVSRAEFMKMVMKAAYPPDGGLIKGSNANYNLFDDLGSTSLASYVHAGVAAGVVNDADGKTCSGNYLCFRPDSPISRLDAVRMLVKAFGLKKEGTPINFGDVSSSYVDIASSVMRDAHCGPGKVRIISGYGQPNCNGKECFSPNAPISREQAAKIIAVTIQGGR